MEQLIISLSGLALTIITIVIAGQRYAKKVHATEVEAAKQRGALEQRVLEAEQDINRVADHLRNISGGQQVLEQSQASTSVHISNLTKSLDSMSKKVDYLIELQIGKRSQ